MKRKIIVLMAVLIQLLCMSIAFAESEDLQKMEQGAGISGGGGQMMCPVPKGTWVCTSPQGYRIHPIHGDWRYHAGVDLGVDYGTPIYAAQSGTVVFTGDDGGGWGNQVLIDHGGGVQSRYGHNSEVLVHTGEQVTKGQIIAKAGSTGISNGPHCHWEVIINGHNVDPGLFCPEVMQAEMVLDPNHKPETADGISAAGSGNAKFEVAADFAKPMRDLSDKFVDVITQALKLIQNAVMKIFGALLTMDIVLGLAKRSMGGEEGDWINWIVFRLVMYGFLMFLLMNWGTIVGGLAMHGFPAIGSMMVGATPEQTAQMISDPTNVMQKGLHIIEPIINEAMKTKGIIDLVTHAATAVICIVFSIIFFLLFLLIAIQIMKAYLEFYFVILFSFTGFMFSGNQHTRKYASNCLNGVFAVSINLMFFCFFAFLLNYTLENVSVGSFVSTHRVESVAGGPITGVEDLMARLRTVESYYGNYHCDNHQGYYGAYQMNKGYYDAWAEEYMANRGNGPALDTDATYKRYDGGPGPYDTENEPTSTKWPWSPTNQDTIARYRLEGFYQQYGSWEAAARAWNQGEGGMENSAAYEYQAMVLAAKGADSVQTTVEYTLLLKLLLVLLIFMVFGDRISKRIMKQFGSPGFKLTNE